MQNYIKERKIISKKTKLDLAEDSRTYRIFRCISQDPWEDDYWINNNRRLYRTWKHNRFTQWK